MNVKGKTNASRCHQRSSFNSPPRGRCPDRVTVVRFKILPRLEITIHLPYSLPNAFFFFDTDVKDKVASSLVPIHATPVSSAHDELLFSGRAVRFS